MNPYNQITGGNTPHPYSGGSGALTRTTVGNTDYTVKAWDEVVALTAVLTANRTWTLPLAASLPPGGGITFIDEAGGLGEPSDASPKHIDIALAGSDTVSVALAVTWAGKYSSFTIFSDGVSKWAVDLRQLNIFKADVGMEGDLTVNQDLVADTVTAVGGITGALIRQNDFGAPLGYDAGAGGTVTQLTSKATAVTLNTPVGRITTHNAVLAAGASVSFTVNNSTYTTNDVVILNSLNSNYRVEFNDSAGDGSFIIRVTNITAGSLSQAVIMGFAIIKGALS